MSLLSLLPPLSKGERRPKSNKSVRFTPGTAGSVLSSDDEPEDVPDPSKIWAMPPPRKFDYEWRFDAPARVIVHGVDINAKHVAEIDGEVVPVSGVGGVCTPTSAFGRGAAPGSGTERAGSAAMIVSGVSFFGSSASCGSSGVSATAGTSVRCAFSGETVAMPGFDAAASFIAAYTANFQAFQRYFDPPVLLALGWGLALAVGARTSAGPLGSSRVAVAALGMAAMQAVFAAATLYLKMGFDPGAN